MREAARHEKAHGKDGDILEEASEKDIRRDEKVQEKYTRRVLVPEGWVRCNGR